MPMRYPSPPAAFASAAPLLSRPTANKHSCSSEVPIWEGGCLRKLHMQARQQRSLVISNILDEPVFFRSSGSAGK